jgi:hypothetical protein
MAAPKLKTIKAGASAGHPSPKEALVRDRVGESDTPYDPEFRRQVSVADKIHEEAPAGSA